MRTVAGRQEVAALMFRLIESGGIPFVVIVEKRYALAAWFVNVFLDTDDRGEIRLEYNLDRARMQNAAVTISCLSADAHQAIYAAIREPTAENQKTAVGRVIDELREVARTNLQCI